MATNTLNPNQNQASIYDATLIRSEGVPLYAICIRGAITDVNVSAVPCDSAIVDLNSGQMIVKIADNDNGVTMWSDLVANGALGKKVANTVAAANTALTDGSIFIGSVANLAAVKALSGDITMTREGVVTIGANAVTRAKMSAAAAKIDLCIHAPTVPASITPTITTFIRMPYAGTVSEIEVIASDTLAASDTNYLTFTVTNLTGTVAMLAVSAANTTKVTGGSALTANTARVLTLHGTPANLVVAAGDWLKITMTGTGTPANAVTSTVFSVDVTATA